MKNEELIRVNAFRVLIFVMASILILAAARLQIFSSGLATSAENSTFERVTHYPARGMLFDRKGNLIVSNKPVYDIEVVYSKIDPKMDTSLFCSLLGIDTAYFVKTLEKDYRKDQRYSKKIPFTFLSKIPEEQFLNFQEYQFLFPGFQTVLRNIRSYETKAAAHVLGYINEANREDINNEKKIYSLGDNKGATGLEKRYEAELRGKKGTSYVLKDNVGRKISSYNQGLLDTAALSGHDLILSLDIRLQEYAEELLNNKKGAVVAIEPKTGEVLVLASAPGYDPDLLSLKKDRSKYYRQIAQDSSQPFFNRAIMAKYPPGSIIKPVMGLIAQQEGLITDQDRVSCPGEYRYRQFTYGCHIHPSPLRCSDAIVHSCNSFFFDAYRKIVEQYGFAEPDRGLDRLAGYLGTFGLGQKLNLDIPGENAGSVPRSEYYDKLYGEGVWRSTYTISLGIGQGELELTTLQMANLAAIIANNGSYIQPHLVKSKKDPTTGELVGIDYPEQNVGIKSEYFIPIRVGMQNAVSYGTGVSASIHNIKVCGKTGTSQNPHGKDHSVFFAFAPAEDPQIAVAVYVENGGWGGDFGSPIAGLIIEKYLNGEINTRKLWLEEKMKTADLLNKQKTSLR